MNSSDIGKLAYVESRPDRIDSCRNDHGFFRRRFAHSSTVAIAAASFFSGLNLASVTQNFLSHGKVVQISTRGDKLKERVLQPIRERHRLANLEHCLDKNGCRHLASETQKPG